jgi:DNA-directed RNA polymerase specialized sigma subunit
MSQLPVEAHLTTEQDTYTIRKMQLIRRIVHEAQEVLPGDDLFNCGWFSAIGAICDHAIDVCKDR